MNLCGAILGETEAPEAGQVPELAVSLLVVGVSEGGFEPPRPIRPLGPQPRNAHGSTYHRVSSSVLTSADAPT
jgi:hypothetical protein